MRYERVRYSKFKKQVLNAINSTDLRISRRSRKIHQSAKKHKPKLNHDYFYPDDVSVHDHEHK